MSDRELLAGYVETWWSSVGDFLTLVDGLEPADWSRPTDLAGWDVHAVTAHVTHLESLLSGGPDETADVADLPHITSPMGKFTEIGVITRRDREPASIISELRAAAGTRRAALLAEPPTDADAPADGMFGMIGWNQRTLLRNRPLDIWMHEQDIRRAVGRPGGMDSAGAQHTADYLSESFGFILGKRVGPPPGTTAVLAVAGSAPVSVEIGEDGRGRRTETVPDTPTVRIDIGREDFIVLAGGRRAAEQGSVVVTGDQGLGQQVVAQLATTP